MPTLRPFFLPQTVAVVGAGRHRQGVGAAGLGISSFASVIEIDLNPVIVTTTGASVIEARIRIGRPGDAERERTS